MPKWRFWQQDEKAPATPGPAPERPESPIAPKAQGFRPPPPRDDGRVQIPDDATGDRLARLHRQRDAVLFEVHQSEAATRTDNPWRERIALLDEALRAVESDKAALEETPVRPGVPLPPTPIAEIDVRAETPCRVAFRIGPEQFVFEEEIDWAERGTQLVRPELVPRRGNARALVPAATQEDRQDEVADHLTGSLFAFATDLRDRALNDRPRPMRPTLADLAQPCSVCGGWKDWYGICLACQRRETGRRELDVEAERLRGEQVREENERAHLADRLPIARRRLADIESQIAAIGG